MARTLLIGIFVLLTALPGLQMAFRFVPEQSLNGVRVDPKKPSLTLATWWKGDLQSQAQAWFDEHIGFRGHAVRTNNQIGLSLWHEASSKAVDTPVLGRRMMVYEDGYITAYDGNDPFPDRQLLKLARGLRRVQDGLTQRGIAFVLLIAPSKASVYPEYLPSGLVRPDGLRPRTAYERMLPMLRSEGVHVVDGHAILMEQKSLAPHAVFPPGGVHWNRYAAALVVARTWQFLGQQLGRTLVDLRCRAVHEDDAPSETDQETDAADLLNAWHVGHADWRFPRPDLYAYDAGDAFRPKIVVVGDSFWTMPASIIADHQMASRSDFYYYFNEFKARANDPDGSGPPPGDFHRGMTWEHVFSADAVIVEVAEITIGMAGYGFIEKARRQLTTSPSEPPSTR